MGVGRTVTNLFHPNLTIFDENNIPGRILANAEKIFINVYVFVTILSLVLLLAMKALIYGGFQHQKVHMEGPKRSLRISIWEVWWTQKSIILWARRRRARKNLHMRGFQHQKVHMRRRWPKKSPYGPPSRSGKSPYGEGVL